MEPHSVDHDNNGENVLNVNNVNLENGQTKNTSDNVVPLKRTTPESNSIPQLTKKSKYEGVIECVEFPNKGIVSLYNKKVIIKNAIPGQKVSFQLLRVRQDTCPTCNVKVLEKSPIEDVEDLCAHREECGGCIYQSVSYEHQLEMKEKQVKKLLDETVKDYIFDGIKGSPIVYGYRNRMDYTFGDAYKGGPLTCGLHKQNHYNDITTVYDCRITDKDYSKLLTHTLEYFTKKEIPFHNRIKHTGVLRNLMIRKAKKTNEILYILITTSFQQLELDELKDSLLNLQLDGTLVGIIHCIFDNITDDCASEKTTVLYGRDHFFEELLGLKFKITPFSFFQTNSLGAEVLYNTVRSYVSSYPDSTVFDLYCGTGTITQMLAPVCKKIIGVEIVEEAVEAARMNSQLNKLTNCEFIAGDVLKVLDSLTENKPELIVLDPPRVGIHPKAIGKIIDFGASRIVYVSCNPVSLVKDLTIFIQNGYVVERISLVDMFPCTSHIETVCLLTKQVNKQIKDN
ncbi:RNA methyltransferase [Entamoeba marina]